MAQQAQTQWYNAKTIKIGLATSIITQPFEVLRTSMILSKFSQNRNINIAGLYQLCQHVMKYEGFKGFFRGVPIAIAKNTVSATVFFTGIENLTKKTKQFLPTDQYSFFTRGFINFMTACTSKFMTTIIVNPFIIIKTKLEVIGCQRYNGALHCGQEIYKNQGLRGFQKGLIPTLLRDVPWSGIQYSTYQFLLNIASHFYETPTSHSGVVLICGASSSIFAIMITFPFDNLRVRWQAGENEGKSLIQIAKDVHSNESIKGFYRGYLPRVLKKACSGGLLWTLYEKLSENDQEKKMEV